MALDIWLALTVLFANFATSLAEARGKAQAESLRKTRRDRRLPFVCFQTARSKRPFRRALRAGDNIVVEAGQFIPGDGEIIDGVASVDESAITGESAPVIREAGGDRSGVTGGTRVLSDRIVVKITAGAGESFLDRMIALVEGAIRQRTPNEIALSLVLAAFTFIFLLVTVTLWPMACEVEIYMTSYLGLSQQLKGLGTDVPTLVALLVCLIPTTIGALLAAIGIAGMDRALRANILAKSGKAVEVAGDIDTLLLDKTGHDYDRQSTCDAIRADRQLHGRRHSADWPSWPRSPTQTPEGKSIVTLYPKSSGRRLRRHDHDAHRSLRCPKGRNSSPSRPRLA